MKKVISMFFLALMISLHLYAQRFIRYNDDDRRFWINVGVAPGLLKASSAYSIKPLFLTEAGLGWQIFAAPHYLVSERINVGLKLGGIFRPTFQDAETNSIVQSKFTSYGLLFADFYLTRPHSILERPLKPRFYVGLGGGVSYIGVLEARDLVTEMPYTFRRRDRDIFLSVAPKVGVHVRNVKLEIEHFVTTPFNPDFTSISIISAIPMGRPRYY
ncbi:MAG: hypothetical protein ACK4GN_01525 [Runella sp.]